MRVTFCLLALLLALPVHATIHRVPSEFGTIQAGIDACAPGDTVLVAPGTYTGDGNRNLDFNGIDLALTSETGASGTVIDCDGVGRAFHFHGGETGAAIVRGFEITGGVGNNSKGGAMLCENSSPTLIDLIIRDNTASVVNQGQGGGIYFDQSSSHLTRVQFIRNVASGIDIGNGAWANGGGILCRASSLVLTEVHFIENRALAWYMGGECCPTASGGGLVVSYDSDVDLNHCLFSGNGTSAQDTRGGGISCSGTVTLSNVTFHENVAEEGPEIYSSNGVTAERCVFVSSESAPMIRGAADLSCCVFCPDHEGVDMSSAEQVFIADPLFCCWCNGDFRLNENSPCLPEHNDCGVLIGALGQGCEDTPVLLSSFTAAPHDEGIELFWQLGGPSVEPDFRLSAEQDGVTRLVSWQEEAPGSFRALDCDAGSGSIRYHLEGREAGEAWQLLGSLDVDLPGAAPAAALLDPFPNPFNPHVTIPVRLSVEERVRLSVHDLAGRRLRVLTNNRLGAGRHDITWDGRDEAGSEQSSGVYLIRLETGNATSTRWVTLLR